MFFLLDEKEPKNQDCLNFLYFLRFQHPRKRTPRPSADGLVRQRFLSYGPRYFSPLKMTRKSGRSIFRIKKNFYCFAETSLFSRSNSDSNHEAEACRAIGVVAARGPPPGGIALAKNVLFWLLFWTRKKVTDKINSFFYYTLPGLIPANDNKKAREALRAFFCVRHRLI